MVIKKWMILMLGIALAYPVYADESVDVQQTYPHAIRVDWDDSTDADGYRICRADESNTWSVLCDMRADISEYTDTSILEGVEYIYSVRPFYLKNNRTVSWGKAIVSDIVTLVPPAVDNIEIVPAPQGGPFLKVSWNMPKQDSESLDYTISYYQIHQKNPTDVTWKYLMDTKNQPNPKSTSVIIDCAYDTEKWYTVRAVYEKEDGTQIYGSYDEYGVKGCMPVPPTARIYSCETMGAAGILVKWKSMVKSPEYADGIQVLRRQGSEEWKVLKTLAADAAVSGAYLDDDVKTTEKYQYSVRCYRNGETEKEYGWTESPGVFVQAVPSAPSDVSASALVAGNPCIQIAWNPADNTDQSVDGYYIYRKEENEEDWIFIGSNIGVDSTVFKDAEAELGKVYRYIVTAYKKDAEGDSVESLMEDIQGYPAALQ